MKKDTRITHNRRTLLQQAVPALEAEAALQGYELTPDPIFEPGDSSSQITTIKRNSKHPNSPFDSSMALTILVLLTALFFMGFLSIYIRRFSVEESNDIRRRRRPPRLRDGGGSNQKNSGVDPTTIRSLPLVSYREGAKQLITDCTICLSEFEERENVKLIPHCRHVFHPECIDTWLSSHVSCPLCRSTQFFDEEKEVRLDVKEDEEANGVVELGGISTVGDFDAWRGVGMRRVCSCTSIGDRLVLQRSLSF